MMHRHRLTSACLLALTVGMLNPATTMARPDQPEGFQVANLAAPPGTERAELAPMKLEIAIVPAAVDGLAGIIDTSGTANATPAIAAEANLAQHPHVAYLTGYIQRTNRHLPPEEANRLAQAILYYSQHYGVDFRLVAGLIAVESSFRKDAVSSSGAIGLGQLKPDTAKWLDVSDPYNPVDNIAGTTRFLSWLLRKYNGSLDHALSAYYQGPGTVDRNGITPACTPYLHKINRALAGLF